jgi:signal transduction histidine kinase
MAIYRIVQEALLNVVKHARAGRVFVNLLRKPQTVSLSIEDDGIGFDPEEKMRISRTGGPLGLHIMRERAVHLGGELFIESRLGGGTYLLVEIPTNSARTTLASEQAGDAVVQYEHSHSR